MTTASHPHTLSRHPHPQPRLNRIVQLGAGVAMLLIVVSAPLQVLLAGVTGGALFLLTAPLTLLLLLPLALLTSASPPVEVRRDGLLLRPVLWRARLVPWSAVQAVKPYPLLPTEDAETLRRSMTGRKKYRPAAGMMLLVRGLPAQYRAGGFFAGEGWRPIIAITNRTHVEYDDLIRQVMTLTAEHGARQD